METGNIPLSPLADTQYVCIFHGYPRRLRGNLASHGLPPPAVPSQDVTSSLRQLRRQPTRYGWANSGFAGARRLPSRWSRLPDQ